MFATLVNTFGDGAYLTTSALFLTRSPYEHHSYRVPDLSDDTVYPSGVYPADAAWSGDGSTVAVGRSQTGSFDPDVLFYAKGSTTPTYAADFRDGDVLWPHSFGTGHAPNPPVTNLGVSASTGSGKNKGTANITVTWTSPVSVGQVSSEQYYWWITASTNGGPEEEIWRGNMDSSGRYDLSYPLPKGTTTLRVRFHDNEGWYPDGYATTTVGGR